MTTTATIAIIIYNTISSTFSSLNALSDTLQLIKKSVIVTKAVNIEPYYFIKAKEKDMKHAKIFIGCLMIILTSCSINEKSAPKP